MVTTQKTVAAAGDAAPGPSSREILLKEAANELVFAVVGHVGSGTSEVANTLKGLLEANLPSGKFETTILKARDVIAAWATGNGEALPATNPNDLATVTAFQDLGDKMRKSKGDHASVAKELALRVRALRAEKTGADAGAGIAVLPDGKRRAYILDSIRHPAEVELLRHIYQDAFVLIGVVCEEKPRLQRLMKKYKNAGEENAKVFMKRDSKAPEKYGQRVSDAFYLADFFVDNTVDRLLEGGEPNPKWSINEELSRLIKILTASEIVRPTLAETAMHEAYGAGMRSACMSRQVGASLVDEEGTVIATGTNEVPKAGGGVYGEGFEGTTEDHRCVYQITGKFCSNNVEQNLIIDELIKEVPELAALDGIRKNALKLELRNSRIGDLIEFSRAVHAEMDAVLSAGRSGVSTTGTRLFVTTFPCHYCARGIVAAGIDEVQYIEPYPKSQALHLHADAITGVGDGWVAPSAGGKKVFFHPFTGIAPRMYPRAFVKDRPLKDGVSGNYMIGKPDWATPWHLRRASYVELEALLTKVG